jgi:hypothetical protein
MEEMIKLIDVSKLSQAERWKLGFAIAAADNLDGECNATNEYFYSGVFGRQDASPDEEWSEPVVPTYEDTKKKFKEFFGFDFDDVLELDTLQPLG